MSRNSYSEINLHMVWHVKNSEPLLTAEVEAFAHQALRDKVGKMEGVFFHEVGGVANHVHVVVSIRPTVLISDLIGHSKGYSSFAINRGPGNGAFAWQDGYGVVSCRAPARFDRAWET